jgi:surfactin synthase thioesterase subunit
LARPHEELAALPGLADQLARELANVPTPFLWGQGAGAIAALATARALEGMGVNVAGVLVAWDDTTPEGRLGAIDQLTDEEVLVRLRRRQAYVDVDAASPDRLSFVVRAYRHDWAEALRELHRWKADPGLAAPITEVLLGTASSPLRDDIPGASRVHRADATRTDPGLILETLDSARHQVALRP